MTLAPEVWGRLVEDERTQDLVVPFIGFLESDDPEFEPPDHIAERLDQAATAIPTVIWSCVSWRNGSVRTRADFKVSFFHCAAHDEAMTMRAMRLL
jgi:hypothetical protein